MKKSQIIIIIITLVLTLGCIGAFALLYFGTDILKSEQEMFYKYAKKIDMKEFINLKSYDAYAKRLKTNAYSNEGEFSIEYEYTEESMNESIKYNGYTDPVNKTANYDISIGKDNETFFEMNYLNNQDFYGVLLKDVVSQYIVFENNNLKEFALKMGIEDTSDIPNKIEIPEGISSVNYEEIDELLDSYLNIVIKEIPKENYSKIKKQDITIGDKTTQAEGYQLILKIQDLKNVFTKILEKAKNDEQLYNLLNSEEITFEDYQNNIDELLVELSEEVLIEENIEVITISVYKQGKDVVKFSVKLKIEEEEVDTELSIEKIEKGMMIKFVNTTINYDDTQDKNIITITKTANSEEQEAFQMIISQESEEETIEFANIQILRNGALTSNNVNFITDINMNVDEVILEIRMDSNTNFNGVPKEGKFEKGNHLVINGLSQEQITNLFTNLAPLLGEKLKDEMFISLVVGANKDIYDSAIQATQETTSSMENYKIQSFNSRLTMYEGVRKGSEIKNIFNTVNASNAVDEIHQVEIMGINSAADIILTDEYKVICVYGTEGYITGIEIKKLN